MGAFLRAGDVRGGVTVPELTLICAWCNATIRQGDPALRPTHGICEACTCLAMAEIESQGPLARTCAEPHTDPVGAKRTAA